jgi:hypothetical protein
VIHADLKNPDYVAWHLFLRDSEGWNREQIEAHQLRELQRIVGHAHDLPTLASAAATSVNHE